MAGTECLPMDIPGPCHFDLTAALPMVELPRETLMVWRWVIFDGSEVVGRVHARSGKEMAELMARTVFPEADLVLKNYSEASKKQRKQANLKMLVRPENCTRLWANPK